MSYDILNSPDLRNERGKFTVDCLSVDDLRTFEAFRLFQPDNPMRHDIPNRENIRGEAAHMSHYYSRN